MFRIRLMQHQDIPAVLRVQAECYAQAMNESEQTLRERLCAAPDTAWLAANADGVCAYLVGYRSVVGKLTSLGGAFDVAARPDSLYLHDLAVSPRAAGSGLGQALVQHACAAALSEGLAYSSLVSVQDSRAFWSRLGYAVFDALQTGQRNGLVTYGTSAWYMVRRL